MARRKTTKVARTYRLPETTVARIEQFSYCQGIPLTSSVAILLNYALDYFLGKED